MFDERSLERVREKLLSAWLIELADRCNDKFSDPFYFGGCRGCLPADIKVKPRTVLIKSLSLRSGDRSSQTKDRRKHPLFRNEGRVYNADSL